MEAQVIPGLISVLDTAGGSQQARNRKTLQVLETRDGSSFNFRIYPFLQWVITLHEVMRIRLKLSTLFNDLRRRRSAVNKPYQIAPVSPPNPTLNPSSNAPPPPWPKVNPPPTNCRPPSPPLPPNRNRTKPLRRAPSHTAITQNPNLPPLDG